MPIVISTIDANDMLMEVDLEGTTYYVGLSWNQEAQQWGMSIRDLNYSLLGAGIAVVANWPLLAQTRRPEYPPGEIVAASLDQTVTRQSFTTGRATLAYLSVAEIADLVS